MLTKYIQGAMRQAKYEILEDNGSFFGSIPGFQGVWANASTLEECRDELQGVLEEWLFLTIYLHNKLPIVDDIELKFDPSLVEEIDEVEEAEAEVLVN
jgi:predicted RNase H-like HicB family nuclease